MSKRRKRGGTRRNADALARMAGGGGAINAVHEGARKRRTERDWGSSNYTAYGAISGDEAVLRARARAAGRDSWTAASAKGAYRRHVVGIGITPRSTARDPDSGEDLEVFNNAIDELWAEWSSDCRYCDVEDRKTFIALEALAMNELFETGMHLWLLGVRPRNSQVGLTIQAIEPEQFDSRIRSFEGRTVWSGVELDAYSAAVAYHVINSPVGSLTRAGSKRIPAWQVARMMRQDRVRQAVGTPWMTPVLIKDRHCHMYDGYEVIRARSQAAFGGVITQEEGEPGNSVGLSGGTGADYTDSRENREIRLEPNMWPVLQPGEDVKFSQATAPNAQYGPFTQQQIQQIAAGIGLDAPTLGRWFADGNFSTQRMARMELYAEVDFDRTNIVLPALRQVRRRFKQLAVTQGLVEAPRFLEDPRWRRAYLRDDWQGPPKQPIDEAKYAAAQKILLSLGLTNHERIYNELGLNWRDELRKVAEIRDFARELEIDIPGLTSPAKTDPREPRPEKKDGNLDPERGTHDDEDVAAALRAGYDEDDDRETLRELLTATAG